MSATNAAACAELRGEDQALVVKQCLEVAMPTIDPSIDAQLGDLSSVAMPITTDAAKLVDLSTVAIRSTDAQLGDLSSVAMLCTTDSAKLVDLSSVAIPSITTGIVLPIVEYKFLIWEKSLSLGTMWLRSVVDFFGQQFYNYIAGLSEKMEKLEYY